MGFKAPNTQVFWRRLKEGEHLISVLQTTQQSRNRNFHRQRSKLRSFTADNESLQFILTDSSGHSFLPGQWLENISLTSVLFPC